METIKYFKEKNVYFLVPLGVSSHLKKWGIQEKNIFELDWWEEINIGNLKFICTPAQHYSGRMGFFKSQKSLWSSWVVESEFKISIIVETQVMTFTTEKLEKNLVHLI